MAYETNWLRNRITAGTATLLAGAALAAGGVALAPAGAHADDASAAPIETGAGSGEVTVDIGGTYASAQSLLDRVNEVRAEAGTEPLAWSAGLEAAAQARAAEIAVGMDGGSAYAENAASGSGTDAATLLETWCSDDAGTDYTNLTSTDATAVGIAAYTAADGTVYLVAEFGTDGSAAGTPLASGSTATVAVPASSLGAQVALSSTALETGQTASASYTLSGPQPVSAPTWSSSDPDVATVGEDGTVTAVAPGTATVELSVDGTMLASAALTVNEPTAETATADGSTDIAVDYGTDPSGQLPETATVTWSNDTQTTEDIDWEAVDPASYTTAAAVSGNQFTVSGSVAGLQVSANVTVGAAPIVGVATPEPLTTLRGTAPADLPQTLTATYADDRTEELPVTWNVDGSTWNAEGEGVDIVGTVDGWGEPVTLHVTLTDPEPEPEPEPQPGDGNEGMDGSDGTADDGAGEPSDMTDVDGDGQTPADGTDGSDGSDLSVSVPNGGLSGGLGSTVGNGIDLGAPDISTGDGGQDGTGTADGQDAPDGGTDQGGAGDQGDGSSSEQDGSDPTGEPNGGDEGDGAADGQDGTGNGDGTSGAQDGSPDGSDEGDGTTGGEQGDTGEGDGPSDNQDGSETPGDVAPTPEPVVAAVDTPAGIAPELPATVDVRLSDGTVVKGVDVTWDDSAVSADDYAAAGTTFTVEGTLSRADDTSLDGMPATCTVTVGEPVAQSVEPVSATTTAGTAPALPDEVEVTYSDGTTENVAVVWDAVDKSLYAQSGSFEVEGTLEGIDGIRAVASVTVAKATPTVTAITDPADVTTTVGTAPVLPDTVDVTLDDKSKGTAKVTWDAVDPEQYAAAGSFTVEGTVEGVAEGSSLKARVTVIVEDEPATAESVEAVKVETPAGIAPKLPEEVEVTYSDGSVKKAAVTWEAVDASQYATAGSTFTVSGTLEGVEGLAASAEVTVGDAVVSSVEDATAETVAGTAPTLPATVKVTWSDGSTTDEAVTWEAVDASKYAQAGSFTVNGTVAADPEAKVACTVTVAAAPATAVGVETPANVNTDAGVAPVLPSTVNVNYSDGSVKQHGVTWDAVAESSYHNGGSFTVNGTVADVNMPVQVTVVVANAKVTGVQNNLAVQTRLGVAPTLPETASVRWSNGDVTNEKVTWNAVDPNLYKKVGSFTVNGTVRGYTVPCAVTVVDQVVQTGDDTNMVPVVVGAAVGVVIVAAAVALIVRSVRKNRK